MPKKDKSLEKPTLLVPTSNEEPKVDPTPINPPPARISKLRVTSVRTPS